jgi:hypothetical protein
MELGIWFLILILQKNNNFESNFHSSFGLVVTYIDQNHWLTTS